MTVGGISCDSCKKHEETSQPYPLGWLKIHVHGRKQDGSDAYLEKKAILDVCSDKCANALLKEIFAATSPTPVEGG